ncbi:hypothetical protein QBC39DRAFT_412547, partial [Podospora conica]
EYEGIREIGVNTLLEETSGFLIPCLVRSVSLSHLWRSHADREQWSRDSGRASSSLFIVPAGTRQFPCQKTGLSGIPQHPSSSDEYCPCLNTSSVFLPWCQAGETASHKTRHPPPRVCWLLSFAPVPRLNLHPGPLPGHHLHNTNTRMYPLSAFPRLRPDHPAGMHKTPTTTAPTRPPPTTMGFLKWTISLIVGKSASPPPKPQAPPTQPNPPLPSPAPSTPHINITTDHRPDLFTSFPWSPPAAPDAQGQDETIRLAIATRMTTGGGAAASETAKFAAWTDLELAQRRAERRASAARKQPPSRRRRATTPIPPPPPATPSIIPTLPPTPVPSPLSLLPPSPPRVLHDKEDIPPSFAAAFPLGPALLPARDTGASGLLSAVSAALDSLHAQHPRLLTPRAAAVVAAHRSPPGGYFSAASIAAALMRAGTGAGTGAGALGVGVLRSGRVGRRGKMRWVREVGWSSGHPPTHGTVVWIYKEEGGGGGGCGPLFGEGTRWRGLEARGFEEGEEGELVRGMREMDEGGFASAAGAGAGRGVTVEVGLVRRRVERISTIYG